MLFTEIQEQSSCRDGYVPTTLIRMTMILMLLLTGSMYQLYGSQSGIRESNPQSKTKWVFALDPAAGQNGSVTITLLPGLQQVCPNARISTDLEEEGETLTIWLEGCQSIPPSASGEMAIIEVLDDTGEPIHVYSMQAGGGAVTVVLTEE